MQIGLISSYPNSGEGEGLAITICSLDILLIGICMVRPENMCRVRMHMTMLPVDLLVSYVGFFQLNLSFFQLLILLHAFRRQSLLHPEIEHDANFVSEQ